MIPTDISPGTNHTAVDTLLGFSFYEDASAAALIILRKGAVDGQIIAIIPLAADAGATIFFPKGVSTDGGCYVQESAGSITGVLYGSSKA